MSGTQVSSAPNVLFDPLMARRQTAADTENQNQLLAQQTTRQEIGGRDIEMGARLASSLLNLDEPSAAQAYSAALPGLQAQGYLKNAPSVYPGHAAALRLAQMGTPSQTLYTYGQNQQANAAILGAGGTGGAPPPPAGPGSPAPYPAPAGAYGQGGRGAATEVPKEYLPFYQEASAKYGIPVDLLIAQHRQESNFNPNARGRAGEIGLGQIMPSTALAPGYGMASVDPATLTDPRANIMFSAEYLARRMRGDPRDPEVQRRALIAYNGGGDPNYVANVTRYLPGNYPQTQTAAIQAQPQAPPPPTQQAATRPPGTNGLAPQPVGTQGLVRNTDGSVGTPNAGGLAAAAPPAPGGVGGQPPPYKEASTTPTPPPTAPAPTPQGQQPAALPTPQAPPPPGTLPFQPVQPTLQLPPMDAENLTAQDRASLAALARSPTTTPQQLLERKTALQNVNQQRTKDAQAQATQQLDQQIKIYQLNNPGVDVQMTGQGMVVLRKDTGQVVQVYPFAPNIRSTVVEGAGPEGQPGHYLYQGANRGDFVPTAEQPAQAGYTVRQEAYKRDSGQVTQLAEAGQKAQGDQVRLQEMQDQLDRLSTGPGTQTKANFQAWLERWMPTAVNPFVQQTGGLSDAASAEVFNKLAFRNATTQERTVAGARGAGAQMTKMFIQSNPGLELLTDANSRMLSVMKIANQADIDYSQGAQNHFTSNEQRFQDTNGKEYTSLAAYDRDWQQQRNPQVYAAAGGALAGLPARDGKIGGVDVRGWATGLSDAEYQRALDIVSRADPNSVVNGKTGRLSMQPASTQNATPPNSTGTAAAAPGVIRYDHTGKRIGG